MADDLGLGVVLSDPAEVEYLTEVQWGTSQGVESSGAVTLSAVVLRMTTRKGDPFEGPVQTRTVLVLREQATALMHGLGDVLTQ